MDVQELSAKASARCGIRVEPHEPAFVLIALNQIVLEETIRETALAAGAFAVGSLGAGAVASLAGASAAGTVAGTTSAAKVGADGTAVARTATEVASAASASRGGSVPPPGSSGPSANGTSPKSSSPPSRRQNNSGTAVEIASVSPANNASSPQPIAQNGSTRSALNDVGGEPLSGSGFEREPEAKGFAQRSSGLGPDRPAIDGGAPPSSNSTEHESQNTSLPGREPPPSDSTLVTKNPSLVGRPRNRNLHGAANRIRNIGRRIALDSAPQVSPPRMPIDHEE